MGNKAKQGTRSWDQSSDNGAAPVKGGCADPDSAGSQSVLYWVRNSQNDFSKGSPGSEDGAGLSSEGGGRGAFTFPGGFVGAFTNQRKRKREGRRKLEIRNYRGTIVCNEETERSREFWLG